MARPTGSMWTRIVGFAGMSESKYRRATACGMCLRELWGFLPPSRGLEHAEKLRLMRLQSWLSPARLARAPLLVRGIMFAFAHGEKGLAQRRIEIWLGRQPLRAKDRARLRVDIRVLASQLRRSTDAARTHHLEPHPLVDWNDIPAGLAPLLASHRRRMLGPEVFDAVMAGPPHAPGRTLWHFGRDGEGECIWRESVDCAATALEFAMRGRRRAFEPASGGRTPWTSA